MERDDLPSGHRHHRRGYRHHGTPGCNCEVVRLRGFTEPCLVLLLAERPAHGYDLLPRLAQFGLEAAGIDAGTLYRTLRRLEDDGLVVSEWSTEGSGPARRMYQVTSEGFEFLRSWLVAVQGIRRSLAEFAGACAEALEGR